MTASLSTAGWPRPHRSAAPRPLLSRSPRRWPARGHAVEARNHCRAALTHQGVRWAPLATGMPASCDLYIGNRGHRVIGLVRQAGRRLFWLHNPGALSEKAAQFVAARLVSAAPGRDRHLSRGDDPGLAALRRAPDRFPTACSTAFAGRSRASRRRRARSSPRTRCAGSTGCSICGCARIAPAVPQAELHIYAGAGGLRRRRCGEEADRWRRSWPAPIRSIACGVRRFAPVGREALAAALAGARVMLYRGDPGETFCLALAEAQAMGVPAVVHPAGRGRRAGRRRGHRARRGERR